MEQVYPIREHLIRLRPCTRPPVLPGIESTAADLEHLTQPHHPKLPLMHLQEPVLRRDSLAKYLATFF